LHNWRAIRAAANSIPHVRSRSGLAVAAIVLAALTVVPGAAAKQIRSPKKAIWGPLKMHDGSSAFPTYEQLGVGLLEMSLPWNQVATRRPKNATNPKDPAYRWPADVDAAVRQAGSHGMRVALMVMWTPSWANGGKSAEWVPKRPQDYADFLTAASRRYPQVRHWLIWGEPSKAANFQPMVPEKSGGFTPLSREQAKAPRYYARLLEASYRALKRVRSSNLVIGGNTYTTGSISPLNWIGSMRLPNGKRPHMDLYGHNPFGARAPDLRQGLLLQGSGYADFSDLDSLYVTLRNFGYRTSRGKTPAIFISEWMLPTDHPNFETNFWFDRPVAAKFLADALRIVRKTPWLYSLGWLALYDDPPRPDRLEVARGLLDVRGNKKPAYFAYQNG
jgi:hypothetical protein